MYPRVICPLFISRIWEEAFSKLLFGWQAWIWSHLLTWMRLSFSKTPWKKRVLYISAHALQAKKSMLRSTFPTLYFLSNNRGKHLSWHHWHYQRIGSFLVQFHIHRSASKFADPHQKRSSTDCTRLMALTGFFAAFCIMVFFIHVICSIILTDTYSIYIYLYYISTSCIYFIIVLILY